MIPGGGLRLSLFLLAYELANANHKSQYSVNESQYTEFNLSTCSAKMTKVGLQMPANIEEIKTRVSAALEVKHEESIDHWRDRAGRQLLV